MFFCKKKNVEKKLKIFKTFKISKIRDSTFVACLLCIYWHFPIVFIFKTERVTAIPQTLIFDLKWQSMTSL